jgi:uncharacterized protein (DUF2147 family)
MQKAIFLLIAAFLSTFIASAQSASRDCILGTWFNEEKDGKIEIYQTGEKYYGKLIWGKTIFDNNGNSMKDTKNPDDRLKKRDLLNLVILTGFIYNDSQWEDGKIYDPKSGKTYSAVIKCNGDILNMRGYIGISLFGRTTVWQRTK